MRNKPLLKLTDLSQLPAVAIINVKALRELAAKSRTARDYRYAGQVEREIGKWERVSLKGR